MATTDDILSNFTMLPPSSRNPVRTSSISSTFSTNSFPSSSTTQSTLKSALTTNFIFNNTATTNSIFENTSTTLFSNASSPDIVLNKTEREVPFYFNFRDEPWVIPLVTISLFNIASILIFEIYVLYKSCGGRRHLFVGQILMLGLFLCSVLGLVHVPQPHWVFCGITRAGVGIAYSIVFGTLLVKCVFLLKVHNGVYFNASFQALLLFFIVAVEVAIVAQWLVYKPPSLTSHGSSAVCEDSPLERVQYLSYVMLLLFMVVVASIRGRSLKENNREALYIGFGIAAALVIWVAWIAVSVIFDRRYEAPAEAFGLVCTSLLVFFLVFVPKAAYLTNPKGSLTHSGSHSVIHTPSFLHLQPHAVLPSSANGTLIKQQSPMGTGTGLDFCRGSNFSSRLWRYDYPSFQQMEPPTTSDLNSNSMKKSNGSSYHSHLY